MANSLVLRPCTTNLTFQVFDRPLHPELVESVAVREFCRDGYRLKLHLTAAGHLISWRWGGFTLVEVLAEQSHPLPESRQLFAHRVGGERTERHHPTEAISYQTCFQVERMSPEIFYHMSDELRSDGENNGVFHTLQTADRLGLSPISYVDLQARPGSVLVHVYHTYPDEYAIVKTQTLIEIEK